MAISTVGTTDAASAAPGGSISPVVVLTAADNGRAVRVHVGDVVEVKLPPTVAGNVMWSWSFPQVSDPSVLTVLPVPVPYGTGLFRAVAPGTVTLTSVETCRVIKPPAVCNALGIRWSASVKVS
jgi:hypothetical protein